MKQTATTRHGGLVRLLACLALICGVRTDPPIWAQAPPMNTDATDAAVPPIGDDDSNIAQIRNAYPEVQSAVTLFLQGDLEGAELQMKRAKDKHPTLPPAGVMMAKLFLNANNQNGARNELEKAVRDEPDDPEAYVVFGNSALQQRWFTDAILLYERALRATEEFRGNEERKTNLAIRAHSGIATVAETRENWERAKSSLESLLALDAENFAARQRLGHVLFQLGNDQDSYKQFQQAYELDKQKVARPEVNMARRYQAKDDDRRAANLMEKAKERDPDGLQTRLAIAQWALETNRLEEAKENATAAVKIDPNNFQVNLLQGVIARIDGDPQAAETFFFRAHEIMPSNGIVLNQLAISLADQDDRAKQELAAQYAQMANKMFGDASKVLGRETLVVLGWVLFRLDRLPQADMVVRQALSKGGVGEDAAYFAARIFFEAGRNDPALQLLNKILDESDRLFPTRKAAQELRGKILSQ